MTPFTLRLLCCGLTILTLLGCDAVEQAQNAANRQEMMNNLRELGLAYHNVHDQNMRGPQNWQEAEKHMSPKAKEELVAAGYIVHWGVKMVDAQGGTSLFVLAYPPNAAAEGGTVLMLDGAVMQMSAQEFNDALAKQKVDSPKAMADAEAAAPSGGGAAAPVPPAGAGPPGPPAAPGY